MMAFLSSDLFLDSRSPPPLSDLEFNSFFAEKKHLRRRLYRIFPPGTCALRFTAAGIVRVLTSVGEWSCDVADKRVDFWQASWKIMTRFKEKHEVWCESCLNHRLSWNNGYMRRTLKGFSKKHFLFLKWEMFVFASSCAHVVFDKSYIWKSLTM